MKAAYKKAQAYLQAQQKDGWYPYTAVHGPSTEATAWCAIALRDKSENFNASSDFFKSTQNIDGGWSTAPGEGKSDWCSGPALFAVRTAAQNLPPEHPLLGTVKKGLVYLDDSRTEFFDGTARIIKGVLQGAESLEYARGWPWSKGCFHWVEPTSYNLYALKIPALPADNYISIAQRANKFLVENQCSVGGWNHGSHLALGVNLPPYVATTAEALLAVQDLGKHMVVQRAMDFLERASEATLAGQGSTPMGLAWMTLAYNAYGKPANDLVSRLIDLQNADGSFGLNNMVTALCTMAVDTENGANPFKFAWTNPKTLPDNK